MFYLLLIALTKAPSAPTPPYYPPWVLQKGFKFHAQPSPNWNMFLFSFWETIVETVLIIDIPLSIEDVRWLGFAA